MEAYDLKIKNNKYLIILGIFLLIILILFSSLYLCVSKESIYPNIKIQGVDVGNLNKEEAKNLLIQNFDKTLEDKTIIFNNTGDLWEFTYWDFDSIYEYDKAISKAYTLGKNGNLFYKIKSFLKFKFISNEIPLTVKFSESKLRNILEMIAENINKQPVDAKIEYIDGRFAITPEEYGLNLKKNEAIELAKEILVRGEDSIIHLPIERNTPKITQDHLKDIDSKLVGFFTNFNPAAKERVENLRIASGMIDGKVVLPGEIFSTYELIGPITEAKGYKNAPVIQDGSLEPGLGGGVCQIATTLFNAAVRADLEIVERRHHSFPVSYVPLGQDATIAGDWIDFKFKNNQRHAIYIQMYLIENRVIANIFGNQEHGGKEIKLETEVLAKIDASIAYKKDHSKFSDFQKVEREARTGYKVNVYKITYMNGEEIDRALLHYDYYKPVDGIIIVGTKERIAKDLMDEKESKELGTEGQNNNIE